MMEAAAGAREARVQRMGGAPTEAEGSIAREIREGAWVPPRTAGLCFDRLQAAQLRLVLGFFQSARLSEGCALVLEAGRIPEAIAACFIERPPAQPVTWWKPRYERASVRRLSGGSGPGGGDRRDGCGG